MKNIAPLFFLVDLDSSKERDKQIKELLNSKEVDKVNNNDQERKLCKSKVFSMPFTGESSEDYCKKKGLTEDDYNQFLFYALGDTQKAGIYDKRDGFVDIWGSGVGDFFPITSPRSPIDRPYFGVKELFDLDSWLKYEQNKRKYVKENGEENLIKQVDTTSQEAVDKAIQQIQDRACSVCKKRRENGEEPSLNITSNLMDGTTKQAEQDSYPKQAYYFPDIALDKYENFDDVIYCYIIGESIYDKNHFIFQYRAECGSVVTEAQPKRRFKMIDDDGVEEFFVSLTDNREDLIEIGGSKLYNTYRKQLIEDLLRQGE